jgi:hypothetical protein
MNPTARTNDLLTEEVGDDLLVYDTISHHAHSLNSTAAFIWRHADGSHSLSQLTDLMRHERGMADATADTVLAGLGQLEECGLMEVSGTGLYTRRDALKKVGVKLGVGVAAGALLAPVVQSIVAPQHARASVGSF